MVQIDADYAGDLRVVDADGGERAHRGAANPGVGVERPFRQQR